MGILRGFRHLPNNLRDWGEWFARQQIESGLGNPDEDGWHLASDADGTRYWEAPPGFEGEDSEDIQRWTIKTFDDDYAPYEGDENNVLLVSTKATAVSVIMEPDIFQDGSQLTIWQYGAGQVTVVEGTNVTVHTPTNLPINEQYGSITLIHVFPNEWMIAGRMEP